MNRCNIIILFLLCIIYDDHSGPACPACPFLYENKTVIETMIQRTFSKPLNIFPPLWGDGLFCSLIIIFIPFNLL